jgi:hypothetical protein
MRFMNKLCLFAALSLFFAVNPAAGQESFFRQYWAEWDSTISNHKGRLLRVNDPNLSLHENFGRRNEALCNGFTLLNVPEDLFGLSKVEFYMEMWGGHPHTVNKRFDINGRGDYIIPEVGTAAGHCTYHYPTIPIQISHLVSGNNAIQFTCERSSGFWGHFIIDNAAMRCYLEKDHPDLQRENLGGFTARVSQDGDRYLVRDNAPVSLQYPDSYTDRIASVDYFARYLGFDDTGNGAEYDWHGYSHDRVYTNHVGSSSVAPFAVTWDTRMIPDQGKPMALRALVRFKNGIHYETPVLDGLSLSRKNTRVQLFNCTEMPVGFWSRASRKGTAVIKLPQSLDKLKEAMLFIKIWDGGEGSIKEPFKVNGHPYHIISGTANHDVVFTKAGVTLSHLRPGDNIITLESDTEHHGIEVLLPGPSLVLRFDQ